MLRLASVHELAHTRTSDLAQASGCRGIGSADSMSISALRQVLAEKLGERDTRRFSDVHLQNLLDKEYSDEGALQDATREGLQTPPALPPALIDKILKVFGQPGEHFADQNTAFLSHKTVLYT